MTPEISNHSSLNTEGFNETLKITRETEAQLTRMDEVCFDAVSRYVEGGNTLKKEAASLVTQASGLIQKTLRALDVEPNNGLFDEIPEIKLYPAEIKDSDPAVNEFLGEEDGFNPETGVIQIYKDHTTEEGVVIKVKRFVAQQISDNHTQDLLYSLGAEVIPAASSKKTERIRQLLIATDLLLRQQSTRVRRYTAPESGVAFVYKSGIETASPEGTSFFNFLNTGITNFLTLTAVKPTFFEEVSLKEASNNHAENREVFQRLVEIMATEERVDADSVLKDWVDVYFNGWNQAFKKRLQITFGKDILHTLAHLDTQTAEEFLKTHPLKSTDTSN